MLGIGGRIERIERVMTIPARHSNDERRLDRLRIREIFLDRPFRFVEVRVWKLPEPQDSAGYAGNVGHAFALALVEPQPVFVGLRRLPAPRLGDRPQVAKAASIAAGVDILEQIGGAVGDDRDLAPKALVAAGPEIPGVTAALLQR